jgi:hypothetical protein
MSKLRLDLESLSVDSFVTDEGSDRSVGTVEGYSQTTATDYWTTLCNPGPEGEAQVGGWGFQTLAGPVVPDDPIVPDDQYRPQDDPYRLPQDDQ